MTLQEIQQEHKVWATRNFGEARDREYWHAFAGVVEEVGELSHAILKQEQSIRGTWDKHEALAQDAVGDIIIYLIDLCNLRGWDISAILHTTWNHVKRRDWNKDPVNGGSEV